MSSIAIPSCVHTFCAKITSFVTKIRLTLHPPPLSSQSQSSSSIDLEAQQVTTPVLHPQNQDHSLLPWNNIVMAFCPASALEISLLFAQTKSQLSDSFHLLSLGILLTFLFLFVSNFIAHKFARIAQVLEKIVVHLVATVFVFTITIPLPLSLRCVTWTLYVISLMVIQICHYCF